LKQSFIKSLEAKPERERKIPERKFKGNRKTQSGKNKRNTLRKITEKEYKGNRKILSGENI